MKELLTNHVYFGLLITALSYLLGTWLQKKTKLAMMNPLLISEILIIATLLIFDIPYSYYAKGGDILNMFLGPITAMLGVSIYRQRAMVRKHIVAIITGTLMGSIASLFTIILLSRLMGLSDELSASLLPKSVTTPIALAISEAKGGNSGITVTALLITGVLGNVASPFLIKLFRVRHPVAKGVAIGSASHVVGTGKAMEMGEDIGALSGIALSFSGIITALIALSIL